MAGVSYSTLRDYVTNHCRRLATTTQPATAMGPTHQAIEQHDLDLLRDLFEAGHGIDNSDDAGVTLLRRAIAVEHDRHLQTGEPLHADMTAFLLARGANPVHLDPDGTTPLHDAESRGHWLAAELIRSWTAHIGASPTLPR